MSRAIEREFGWGSSGLTSLYRSYSDPLGKIENSFSFTLFNYPRKSGIKEEEEEAEKNRIKDKGTDRGL